MKLHEFEVFHFENVTQNRVVDSQEPIVGKRNAIVFAGFLQDESKREYFASKGKDRKSPRLYWLRNLKTGKLLDYEGKGIGLGSDMTGITEFPSIECPTSPNYMKNYGGVTHGDPCVVCGKGITHGAKHVIMDLKTNEILNPHEYKAAEERGDDLEEGVGEHPIGSDCLRKHPELKKYTV